MKSSKCVDKDFNLDIVLFYRLTQKLKYYLSLLVERKKIISFKFYSLQFYIYLFGTKPNK